ncbi:MAG: hypothetical protein ACRD5K_20645 [Candidatus Acidiferrales bacterium]
MAKDDTLRGVKIRVIVSLLLAVPLAVASLAVVDYVGLPQVIRYAVSPGFIFGVNAAPSGSWIGDISNALRYAIAGNEVYYAILIFLVLSWVGRKKRTSEPLDQEIVEQRRQA